MASVEIIVTRTGAWRTVNSTSRLPASIRQRSMAAGRWGALVEPLMVHKLYLLNISTTLSSLKSDSTFIRFTH